MNLRRGLTADRTWIIKGQGTQMDRTSLYRAIAPLERDGWIEVAAGVDARSRSARITRKGERVLSSAAAEWDELQRKLIKSFGKDEWNSLSAELKRLSKCAVELDRK